MKVGQIKHNHPTITQKVILVPIGGRRTQKKDKDEKEHSNQKASSEREDNNAYCKDCETFNETIHVLFEILANF